MSDTEWTLDEAAKALSMSPNWVKKAIINGWLPGDTRRHGLYKRRWYIRHNDLEQFAKDYGFPPVLPKPKALTDTSGHGEARRSDLNSHIGPGETAIPNG